MLRTAVAIGNLRVAVTLMVLAQHAIVAYHPFAPAPQPSLPLDPRTWLTFPILDGARSNLVPIPTVFNDVFGMALMFMLSGLFVWPSLDRKGPRAFLRDRLVRLGPPFAIAAVVLTPLAYYPSYLVTTDTPSLAGFAETWLSMGLWPGGAGPAWFLWMLLAFDTVAAGVAPSLRAVSHVSPARLFVSLALASVAAYVPMAGVFDAWAWAQWGPFKMQASRVLLYLLYFLFGVAVGMTPLDRGLLSPDGRLAERWRSWTTLALVCFLAFGALALQDVGWPVHVAFALSCTASTFAVLAVFLRFGNVRSRATRSLETNAYTMYVVHYVFLTWLQYALLPMAWPAVAKASFVFAMTVLASWTTSLALRRLT